MLVLHEKDGRSLVVGRYMAPGLRDVILNAQMSPGEFEVKAERFVAFFFVKKDHGEVER